MLRRYRDVFASLRSHEVKYVVIGGIAAVSHGVPRATFDLDILIEASMENAVRLVDALRSCGVGSAWLTTPEEILAHEITIFKDTVRLDVQTSTPGIQFNDAWRDHREMVVDEYVFYVLSKEHLIQSKRAAGRKVDLDDIDALS
ncbi:MAG: nucleotidyltransferase [Candidatus Solibacter usitatus]|nr:nucleotidyltransferase [Candidatus Solibacter usitatus]